MLRFLIISVLLLGLASAVSAGLLRKSVIGIFPWDVEETGGSAPANALKGSDGEYIMDSLGEYVVVKAP